MANWARIFCLAGYGCQTDGPLALLAASGGPLPIRQRKNPDQWSGEGEIVKHKDVRLGTVEAVFNKLGGPEGAQRFLSGRTRLVDNVHVIDCTTDPLCPEGWQFQIHLRQVGQFTWNPLKVKLFVSEDQAKRVIFGRDLYQDLIAETCFNANILDYLLDHPELIPKEWRGRFIFFWGTIYTKPNNVAAVRCLQWDGLHWTWNFALIDSNVDGFGKQMPAAVLFGELPA